ncbi:MAG: hypothetical protein SNJ70_05475 [Armatimonadota bacterium]
MCCIDLEKSLKYSILYTLKMGINTRDIADIKGHPLIINTYINPNIFNLSLRKFVYGIDLLFPKVVENIFKIKKNPTSGGVANLSSLYLELYKNNSNNFYLEEAKKHLNYLHNTKIEHSDGYGWGFPFDWYIGPKDFKAKECNQHYIVKAFTPIGHTTMTSANAFLDYFDISKDSWAIDIVNRCCKFLINGLKKTNHKTGSISLSYTPIDDREVINTNADIASLLIRAYEITNDQIYIDYAVKMIDFVVENQNINGSWYYYSYDYFGAESFIDGYHTCMILSSIDNVATFMKKHDNNKYKVLCDVLAAGINYYTKELLIERNEYLLTKDTDKNIYPLNSYSFAQGIYTLSNLSISLNLEKETKDKLYILLSKLIYTTFKLMMEKNGEFLTLRFPFLKYKLKSLRWTQAFMCRALLNYCNLNNIQICFESGEQ